MGRRVAVVDCVFSLVSVVVVAAAAAVVIVEYDLKGEDIEEVSDCPFC